MKKENVVLYSKEANLAMEALRRISTATMDFHRDQKTGQLYTKPTRDEIRDVGLAAIPSPDFVIRQIKILIKIWDDGTPPLYKRLDLEKFDGTGTFFKVEDDSIAFDPESLPSIP